MPSTPNYTVPGVYRYDEPSVGGFRRLRTDIAGFVGIAGTRHLGDVVRIDDWKAYEREFLEDARGRGSTHPRAQS